MKNSGNCEILIYVFDVLNVFDHFVVSLLMEELLRMLKRIEIK